MKAAGTTIRNDQRFAHLTLAQRDAIATVDRSLLVSAAAGSGKTTVLAERCAYLVCDLPADQRCSVNELLVVTFTEAAASEMRQRIGKAIRQRIETKSRGSNAAINDDYLRSQLYLLDSADISTIHAFCKTIVQKWFPQTGIDPQASVLSGDEAQLLRRDVLTAMFDELYAINDANDANESSNANDEAGIGAGANFRELVDQYGAGEDREIVEVVLAVHDFTNSLADPRQWLEQAVEQALPNSPTNLIDHIDELQNERLQAELSRYTEYAEYLARVIRDSWPQAVSRAEAVDAILSSLQKWREQLTNSPQNWESVAASIRAYEFPRLAPKPRGLSKIEGHPYDAAKVCVDQLKEQIRDHLIKRVCRFTAAEYRDGLVRTAPYVRTLVELVRRLDQRYRDAKSAQAAMDFNDLQRYALKLLAENGDSQKPSAIARQLQQQYRYVLVDEFQDVDPLQAAILRLISRESADEPTGNWFTVGDIKQSIYRFRLAEPRLFADRARAFTQPNAIGRLIHLQENFRSRSVIVDGVNALFRCLMSESFGGSTYDQHAELHAAATYPTDAPGPSALPGPLFDRPAIEVHLIAKTSPVLQTSPKKEQAIEENATTTTSQANSGDREDDNDSDGSDSGDGESFVKELQDIEDLENIEREAYLIAQRIHTWMGQRQEGHEGGSRWYVAGKPTSPGEPPIARPIEYSDIVILLRAMPHKAEPIADVLRRMNIPVRLEGASSRLESVEFNDVRSLLAVLDNPQQDISLAAVLRGPMLGEPLSESDLLEIRLMDREVPFYVAVQQYVTIGRDETLQRRLDGILKTIKRYRQRMQREPVAEVLWEIYEQTGYLSYVSGLPDGLRRRGHLIRLHELARQFGQFARQGLRRFLRYLDEMIEQDRGGPPISAGAGSENVVRIMTIHASKGLEFPVVVLADLSKNFNLTDTHRIALFDSELKLALQVADAERRVRYPTLLHQLVAERSKRECLSEELRVLYVALTRAREHLMLVGSCSAGQMEACRNLANCHGVSQASSRIPPRMQLESAGCILDWLLPTMGAMPVGTVQWGVEQGRMAASKRANALWTVDSYDRSTTDGWQIPPAQRPEALESLARLGRLEPLPKEEPICDANVVQQTMAALEFVYPGLELTSMPARQSVSDLKRAWSAQQDIEQQAAVPNMTSDIVMSRPAFLRDGPQELDRAARGVATHRLLQLLDLTQLDLAPLGQTQPNLTQPSQVIDELCRQRDAIVAAGRMSKSDVAAVDLADIAWFLATDLGRGLCQKAELIQREVPFVSRVGPEQVDAMVRPRDHRDVVLIRGMVDLLLVEPTTLSIVDFKTDDVVAEACEARAVYYRPQLTYYADAMAAVYHRPVLHAWLVFLKPRRVLDLLAK